MRSVIKLAMAIAIAAAGLAIAAPAQATHAPQPGDQTRLATCGTSARTVVVVPDSLRLRNGPSTNYGVGANARGGQRLRCDGWLHGGWYTACGFRSDVWVKVYSTNAGRWLWAAGTCLHDA